MYGVGEPAAVMLALVREAEQFAKMASIRSVVVVLSARIRNTVPLDPFDWFSRFCCFCSIQLLNSFIIHVLIFLLLGEGNIFYILFA